MNERAGEPTDAHGIDDRPTPNDASADLRREDLKAQDAIFDTLPTAGRDGPDASDTIARRDANPSDGRDATADAGLDSRARIDASLDMPDTLGDAPSRDSRSGDARDAGVRDAQRAIDTVPALSLLAGTIGGAGTLDGTGPAARFCLPTGMARDGAGNLFVTDNGSHIVRKVVLATGEVTTFAGRAQTPGAADGVGATARFSSPQGLASDGAGNLFVADHGNHAIRRIELATGRVTTLAGSADRPGVADGASAVASFVSPAGIAADGSDAVYVTDQDSHTIRKIELADGQVTTLAGLAGASGAADGVGPDARFHFPDGLAADGNGKLFVADTYNGAIRAVALATAEVTTLDTGPLMMPAGIASDGQGRLYITDRSNMVLLSLSTASGPASLLAGKLREVGFQDGTGSGAAFTVPWGLALDGNGDLLVADQSNHILRRVAIATGAVTTLAGKATDSGSADGIGDKARFSGLNGLLSDGQGNLFATDASNHVIRQVVMATGQVTTLAGSHEQSGTRDGIGAAASFMSPAGITGDGQGNLFVTDTSAHVIRRIAVATAEVTTLAGAPAWSGSADGVGEDAHFYLPWGIAADDAGNLFVSDANEAIRKVVIATRTVTTLAGLAEVAGHEDGVGSKARFASPMGLAWDAGNLFVADSENHTIRCVSTADGTVTTVAGSPGEKGSTDGSGRQARFGWLYGLAHDHAGHLWIADGDTVRKLDVSPGGAVTTVVGSPDGFGVRLGPLPGSLTLPYGLAFVEPRTLFISAWNAILQADL